VYSRCQCIKLLMQFGKILWCLSESSILSFADIPNTSNAPCLIICLKTGAYICCGHNPTGLYDPVLEYTSPQTHPAYFCCGHNPRGQDIY
jgi:hypothetical protein